MPRILAVFACLFASPIAFAEDKPNSNALSPKEIAEGWILLFDGVTTYGWKIDGDAVVKDGALVIGGSKKSIAAPTTQFFACDLKMECEGLAQVKIKNKVGVSGYGLPNQPT